MSSAVWLLSIVIPQMQVPVVDRPTRLDATSYDHIPCTVMQLICSSSFAGIFRAHIDHCAARRAVTLIVDDGIFSL